MSFAALTIDINAKLASLETDLKRAQQLSEETARKVDRIGSSFQALGSGLRQLGIGVSIGLIAKAVVDATDAFARIDSQLRNATRSTFHFAEAQRELFGIAQKTRQSYEVVATAFAQISGTAGSSIGTQTEQLRFFETVSKLIAISGASAQQASNGLTQFRQGLAAGALRGEEFNSVMENIPQVGYAIADGLGVGIAQLRAMAANGELTAERIKTAMDQVEKSVDDRFKNVQVTFDSAMTKLGNSFQLLVNRIEKETGGPLFELVNLIDFIGTKLGKLAGSNFRDSIADRVNDLNRQIAEQDRAAPGNQFAGLKAAELRAERDKLLEESRRAMRLLENEKMQVDQDMAAKATARNVAAWEELVKKYQSAGEKAAAMAKEIRAAGLAAGKSEAEIRKLIAAAAPKEPGRKGAEPEWVAREREMRDLIARQDAADIFSLTKDTTALDDLIRAQDLIDEEKIRSATERWKDLIDPTREYARQLDEIRALVAAGKLTPQQGIDAEFNVESRRSDELFPVEKIEKAKSAAEELGLTFKSAFEDAIIGGEKLSKVLDGVVQDIARLVIRKSITEPFVKWLGGLLPSADGNVFDPSGHVKRFAAGGIVSGATPFTYAGGLGVMGEAGPEAIMPLKRGRDGKLGVAGGGGATVIQHINVGSGVSYNDVMAAMLAAKEEAKREIYESTRRGGAFA